MRDPGTPEPSRADGGADRLRGDAVGGAGIAWARNVKTADRAKEVATEIANARAAAPVATSTTAAIRVIYDRRSKRTMDR